LFSWRRLYLAAVAVAVVVALNPRRCIGLMLELSPKFLGRFVFGPVKIETCTLMIMSEMID
jgi:hypothetical protein